MTLAEAQGFLGLRVRARVRPCRGPNRSAPACSIHTGSRRARHELMRFPSTSAARALIAALLRAGQLEVISHEIQQRRADVELALECHAGHEKFHYRISRQAIASGVKPVRVWNLGRRTRRRRLAAVEIDDEFGDEGQCEARSDHRRRGDRDARPFEDRPELADHEDERTDCGR